MSDNLVSAVQKLVTDGIIEKRSAEPIYRLCMLFHTGAKLPPLEYQKWKELGYIQEHDDGSITFGIEEPIEESLNWALMGQCWEGNLVREFRDGQWYYKNSEKGKRRAERLISKLSKQNKEQRTA